MVIERGCDRFPISERPWPPLPPTLLHLRLRSTEVLRNAGVIWRFAVCVRVTMAVSLCSCFVNHIIFVCFASFSISVILQVPELKLAAKLLKFWPVFCFTESTCTCMNAKLHAWTLNYMQWKAHIYLSINSFTSLGIKGVKKQSSIFIRENVKLPSLVGTISFRLLLNNFMLGWKMHT